MSEPSDWAKAKARELCSYCALDARAFSARCGRCDALAAALEEAAMRERWACHKAALDMHERHRACCQGTARGAATAIGDRGPMLAPDSQRGAA